MQKISRKQFRKNVLERTRQENGGKLICKECGPGKIYPEKDIVADHIDNNPNNNVPENGQPLCRKHNYTKNPPNFYKLKDESLEIVRVSAWEVLRSRVQAQTAEYAKGDEAKPKFMKWFYTQMLKKNELPLEETVSNGTFIADVSPETIRFRYLRGLTAPESYCTIRKEDKMIVWQPGKRERFLREKYEELFKKYGK